MTGPGSEHLGDRGLDGNAVAGPLRELFAVDLSAAECTCAHCGATGPLAEHEAYADCPALVLRCRHCSGVVLRYSSIAGVLRLDLSGSRLLVVRPSAVLDVALEPATLDLAPDARV